MKKGFIQDFQTFSHGKSRDVSTALKTMSNLQKIANWLDKHKQPKKAMEVFLEEARKTMLENIGGPFGAVITDKNDKVIGYECKPKSS